MRQLLEILGLRTPERGRDPVALPSSIRWILPLIIVSAAAVGAVVGRLFGALFLQLVR
ncbi:MAG: hypothetical protein ACJ76P_10655 [Actinomycetota bacterium]|jgi:hypothetical protein